MALTIDDNDDDLLKALQPRPMMANVPLAPTGTGFVPPINRTQPTFPSLSPKLMTPEAPMPSLSSNQPVSVPNIGGMPTLDWRKQATDLEPHGWRKALGLGLAALAGGAAGYRDPAKGEEITDQLTDQVLHGGEERENAFLANRQKMQDEKTENELKQAQINKLNAQPEAKPQPSGKWTVIPNTNREINDLTGESREISGMASPAPKPAPIPTPHPGTINGKPAWGILTPQGWQDPGTHQQLNGFKPQPAYAETGLYEPVTDANGQTVKFDKRTGTISPIGGGNAPILSPQQSGELKSVEEGARNADTQLRVMQENLPDALKGDQQAQLSLVANHIGMTLGQQKGARINQAVWNEAIQSAPWLARVKARFGPDGYLSGVTLTPDQMHQMVSLGEQRRRAVWRQVHDTMTQFGATDYSHVIPNDLLGGDNQPWVQKNAAGQYRYSTDGGKTWKQGRPNASAK